VRPRHQQHRVLARGRRRWLPVPQRADRSIRGRRGARAAVGENPKGNADTERFLRTLKEELVWLRPAAFFEAIDRWLADYNASYLHSALGYRAPLSSKPSISATPLP
jgi:transposase InsO family protein